MDTTTTGQQPLPSSSAYQPIEDYGMIGDLHTVALVGKGGSIDWCCLPHFDSPSVFGALLDRHQGGLFHLAPTHSPDISCHCRQLYVPETNILVTRFLSEEGVAEITDFMPLREAESREHRPMIVRSIKVIRGSLPVELVCRPAFNYARDPHDTVLSPNGAAFHSKNLSLWLTSSLPLEHDDNGGVRASFRLHAGRSARFYLECARREEHIPTHRVESYYYELLQHTLRSWRNWLSQCQYQGRWREMVQRSALVLKLLTFAPTGAIVSSPTTSLPETIGGSRTWDYRYTWLRDASFTIYSLQTLGLTQETEAFMSWLEARCHEMGAQGTLQPVYGIRGEHTRSMR